MNEPEAMQATGLIGRYMTPPKQAHHGYINEQHIMLGSHWRCQLGVIVPHVAVFTVREVGGPVHYSIPTTLFHLRAWGSTWDAAYQHWLQGQPQKVKVSA